MVAAETIIQRSFIPVESHARACFVSNARNRGGHIDIACRHDLSPSRMRAQHLHASLREARRFAKSCSRRKVQSSAFPAVFARIDEAVHGPLASMNPLAGRLTDDARAIPRGKRGRSTAGQRVGHDWVRNDQGTVDRTYTGPQVNHTPKAPHPRAAFPSWGRTAASGPFVPENLWGVTE